MKKRRQIIVDFEVLSKADFWLCCMKDVLTGKEHTIINDKKEFLRVFNKNKDSIWIGYNIKGYDQWIMKALLSNISPGTVSDAIVKRNINPWEIDSRLNKQNLYFFELSERDKSLKELELFMGEDIQESSVSFDLDRKPTPAEIEELSKYCMHDVRMTYKVFGYCFEEYESHENLIDMFNLKESMFGKTKAQLSSVILGAKKPEHDRNDEFNFEILDVLNINRYKDIVNWYKDSSNRDYKKSMSTYVYGVLTEFGWGGLHSARKQYSAEGIIIISDVRSFYPSMMIEYSLLSRNVVEPKKFSNIRDMRVELKAKKDPREKPLKKVINATFGSSKDSNNELYDPQRANSVCVNGQLLLLDLIEKVEDVLGNRAELIQSNTDGVAFWFETERDAEIYLQICEEWSKRTGMFLEHDRIKKVIQKDVNNYVFISDSDKPYIKSKGSYVKKLSPIDNDLPIINKALIEYLVNGTNIEDTINNADNLIDFQKCVKISRKYKKAKHGASDINLKVLRVFASKLPSDGAIVKVRENGSVERIGNTPNRAFIDNGNIIGKKVPDKLDKQWYIDLAQKRLLEFLPNAQYEYTLFDMLN